MPKHDQPQALSAQPPSLETSSEICYLHLAQRISDTELTFSNFCNFIARAARIASHEGITQFSITLQLGTEEKVAGYLQRIGTQDNNSYLVQNWRGHKELRIQVQLEDQEMLKRFQKAIKAPLSPEAIEALSDLDFGSDDARM